jgi:hypothetical protein
VTGWMISVRLAAKQNILPSTASRPLLGPSLVLSSDRMKCINTIPPLFYFLAFDDVFQAFTFLTSSSDRKSHYTQHIIFRYPNITSIKYCIYFAPLPPHYTVFIAASHIIGPITLNPFFYVTPKTCFCRTCPSSGTYEDLRKTVYYILPSYSF